MYAGRYHLEPLEPVAGRPGHHVHAKLHARRHVQEKRGRAVRVQSHRRVLVHRGGGGCGTHDRSATDPGPPECFFPPISRRPRLTANFLLFPVDRTRIADSPETDHRVDVRARIDDDSS